MAVRPAIATLDARLLGFAERWSTRSLRYGIAVVFIWFGALKPLGVSSATELVAATVYVVDPALFVPFLGIWEVVIGLCFLYRPAIRIGIALLAVQMVGTFLPLVLLPEVTFSVYPTVPTLEGQYIIKNIVVIGAAITVGSTLPPVDRQ
jgi:hypothetical protein